jgi:hypothetical protein
MLDAIKEYHYYAPAMLALAERSRRPEPTAMMDRTSMPLPAVRPRLSALLKRLGVQFRLGHTPRLGAATAIVGTASRANG